MKQAVHQALDNQWALMCTQLRQVAELASDGSNRYGMCPECLQKHMATHEARFCRHLVPFYIPPIAYKEPPYRQRNGQGVLRGAWSGTGQCHKFIKGWHTSREPMCQCRPGRSPTGPKHAALQ